MCWLHTFEILIRYLIIRKKETKRGEFFGWYKRYAWHAKIKRIKQTIEIQELITAGDQGCQRYVGYLLTFSINTYKLDEKRLKTANINNLLIRDKNKEVIKTCKSESLKKFQEKRVQFRSLSKKKEEDSDCSIELPDYKAGEKSLEKLNDEVMAAEYLKKFKKVISFYWFSLLLSFLFV